MGRLNLRIDDEDLEYWKRNADSVSGKTRRMIESFNEAEQDLGIDDDMEEAELAVLKTYLTAINKNIQRMEIEKEKIEAKIEEIEEQHSTDRSEVVEIKLPERL